mmetsp:Transcript_46989/g.123819  ORF Transcript_46989/g.123819 Transcript_46989/m.123819 type:complete len:759 (+) Transcript_46989:1223-3499(+)
MVEQAKAEKLSVEAARDYLNSTLLRPPYVSEELLADYNMSLPISLRTAWFWMKQSGAVSGTFKQSFYNDHHESAMVTKDKQERCIPSMDTDELRQPLWVQLPLAEYEELKRDGAPNLPEGHRYTVMARSGGGGRTLTRVERVELHVDDADAFDERRAASPYGGNFSVRFPGGLARLPSAPPAALPNPAEDTLSAADAEAAAEAAAETARAQQPEGAPPTPAPTPELTVGRIKQMKVAELRAVCEARGLETASLKAALQDRLQAHVAGEAAADEEADDSEEYDVRKIHSHRVVDRQLQYLVEWKGWDGEQTWEPEAHLDGYSDELYAYYNDPEHRQPGCEYGHRNGICKCHCPLHHEGQDETVFKEYAYSTKQWNIKGLRSLRKKSDGRGRHLSGTQSELRGTGFPLTAAELETVNAFRERRGRPPLDCSPGMRFLDFGKNKDGYWDYDKFLQQVIDYIDAFEALHPDWQLLFEVDWSSGHAKHRDGSLNTNTMNVGYGGGQKIPRDAKIPTEDADLYLGPHPASFTFKGKTYDQKLKPGETQRFHFTEDDPPPFHDLEAPKFDTTTGKTNRKGEPIIKEGYVGKAKGMRQTAWERGWHKPASEGKMHGRKVEEDSEEDPTFSLPQVLSSCWDFAHEKTALQEYVESRGHILRMCVKGHPELAGVGIEYSWGRAKQKFRRDVNDRVSGHLHRNIVKCFSREPKFLPLSRIRKYARKTRAYRRAYRDGKSNSLASLEKLVKQYKQHRSAEVFDRKFVHDE